MASPDDPGAPRGKLGGGGGHPAVGRTVGMHNVNPILVEELHKMDNGNRVKVGPHPHELNGQSMSQGLLAYLTFRLAGQNRPKAVPGKPEKLAHNPLLLPSPAQGGFGMQNGDQKKYLQEKVKVQNKFRFGIISSELQAPGFQ